MTDPITSSPLITSIPDAIRKTTVENKTTLDKDAFLKLLVAQMKYQDPSKPVDSSAFMAQTAQFTQVEKMESMAADSKASLVLQQGLSASSMVGKNITYLDADGTAHTGKVDSARFGGTSSEPTLSVGGADVALSKVTTVAAGA